MIIEDKEQFWKDWLAQSQTTMEKEEGILEEETVKELIFDLIDNLGVDE